MTQEKRTTRTPSELSESPQPEGRRGKRAVVGRGGEGGGRGDRHRCCRAGAGRSEFRRPCAAPSFSRPQLRARSPQPLDRLFRPFPRAWDVPRVGPFLRPSPAVPCRHPPPRVPVLRRSLCRAVMQWSLQDGLFLNWSFLRLTNAGTSSSISGL